jgi:hypothetical protein
MAHSDHIKQDVLFLFFNQIHKYGVTQAIPSWYNSRKVPAIGDLSGSSAIHVIKDPRQVLPYCVIILEV